MESNKFAKFTMLNKSEITQEVIEDYFRNDENRKSGLLTKIWGHPAWEFNTAVVFGYPVEPTDEQKRNYHTHFENLANILPCKYCRDSYLKIITTEGPTKLTDEVFNGRASLTRWWYNVHQAINEKLEMDYATSYEDMVDLYESFRAKCVTNTNPLPENKMVNKGCVIPYDYKAMGYLKLYNQNAPVIQLEIARRYKDLALKRGIDDVYFKYLELAEAVGGDFKILKRMSSWFIRNRFCQTMIRQMREECIPSVETDGEYADFPTIEELKLILFLCSNLNRSELAAVSQKL